MHEVLNRIIDELPLVDGRASLKLRLDLLPALLQYLISTGTGIENHVAYLSLERLCMKAIGRERVLPQERYAPLLEFEKTLHMLYGGACSHMLHGQGMMADEPESGAMDGRTAARLRDCNNPAIFLALHNSGHHHPNVINRHVPASDVYGGAQLHALLSFFEHARVMATDVTFAPAEGLLITLCDAGVDGLMLGAGAMVDEHELAVFGLQRRVRYEEALRVLEMEDAERAEWYTCNPAVTTALEYKINTADNRVSGHIGYVFVVGEGDHKQAARSVAKMLAFTRICRGCLLAEWHDELTPRAAAKALRRAKQQCDAFCFECLGDEDTGPQWRVRRCSACVEAGCNCEVLNVMGCALDCGGNQAGLIRRAFEGVLERDEEPYHAAGGYKLHGCRLLPDGAHVVKLLDSGMHHHKLWLRGTLCGHFQLYSRFYDADAGQRSAVRQHLSHELLRRKNAFSVEAAVLRRERGLIAALLSDAEHKAERAWLVHQLGPSRVPWRENTAAMYGAPMGLAYHTPSNLLFFVDRGLCSGRVMKLSHTPADTAAFTKRPASKDTIAQLRAPIDITLVGTLAYITDADAQWPGLYVVDVKHVCANFNTAQRVVDSEGDESDSAREGGGGGAMPGKVIKVGLSGERLLMPFGITAGDEGSQELYVSDRQTRLVYQLTLSAKAQGSVRKLLVSALCAPPAALHLATAERVLLVAAGDSIYATSVATATSTGWQRVLQRSGANFSGVSVAAPSFGGALFAIDHAGNAVLSLAREPSTADGMLRFAPSASATILAGGNTEQPCSKKASIWYEGTASKVTLWEPTFGIFVRGSFVFMNGGTGSWGKVLLLNDLYPMVNELLPATLAAADAFALSQDARHHAVCRMHAALLMTHTSNLLDEMVEENAEANPRSPGLEGPVGNFSRVVRRSCRHLATLLLLQGDDARALGAPQRCLDAMTAMATTTLGIERFFSLQRARYPNPYSLQYAHSWGSSLFLEGMRRRSQSSFSFCTARVRVGRGHYHNAGSQDALLCFQLQKSRPKKIDKKSRLQKLKVLHLLASLFKQARQGRVTDKGKERVGAMPASTYAPPALLSAPAAARGGPFTTNVSGGHSLQAEGDPMMQLGATMQPGATEEVLFRAGDIVSVRSVTGEMWVAQLKQPIIIRSPSVAPNGTRLGTFASARVACRYFVQTAALFTIGLEHAAAYWKGLHGALGERLKLTDEASALARADASEGIHYSFEKPDHVTCSTVHERLLTFDVATYRGELVSFSIAEASVEAAREHIELLEAAEEEDAEEDMLQARSAAMEVAAAQAQAEDAAKVKRVARAMLT